MTPAEKLSRKKKPKSHLRRNIKWKTNLESLRLGLNLTMRDVASAVDLTCARYFVIEKGGDPRLTNASKIALFFGTTIEAIWSKPA